MAEATIGIQDPNVRTRSEIELNFPLAQSFSRPWHDNIKLWRRWYAGHHYEKPALPFEDRYADPTPTNVVDLAVGMLTTKALEFTAHGWNPSVEEEQDAGRIEKYLAGTIYANNEREGVDIPYEVVTHLVRDGAAILYSVWDPELAKGSKIVFNGKTLYDQTPIRVQVIDPLQIFVLPGGPKRWASIFRVWEMTVHDAEMTFNRKIATLMHLNSMDRMTQKIEIRDWWRVVDRGDGEYVVESALLAHDEVIRALAIMPGYEDLPYSIGFFKPVSRDSSADWHNIMRPLEDTIRHLERSINRRAKQILVYTSLPLIARTIANRNLILDPALGNMVTMTGEEGLEYPKWPGNAPDVEMHINFLRARLQQAGFTDVMFGEGPSQVSGYALSQLGDQNRIRLSQPVIHLEMMWSSWARKVLRMTTNFTGGKIDIRVYGSLKGQDFIHQLETKELEYYIVRAVVKPEFPNERTRNHAMAIQVRDLLSERTVMENYLEIDQPDDERERRMDDMISKDPAMIRFQVLQRLLEYVKSEDEMIATAASMAVQQLQASGVGGPQGGGTGMGKPGAPDGAPAPGNALGLQSAGGGATPQAGGAAPAGGSFTDKLRQMTEAAPGLTPGGGGV
jgi:hypothetical protein